MLAKNTLAHTLQGMENIWGTNTYQFQNIKLGPRVKYSKHSSLSKWYMQQNHLFTPAKTASEWLRLGKDKPLNSGVCTNLCFQLSSLSLECLENIANYIFTDIAASILKSIWTFLATFNFRKQIRIWSEIAPFYQIYIGLWLSISAFSDYSTFFYLIDIINIHFQHNGSISQDQFWDVFRWIPRLPRSDSNQYRKSTDNT